MKSINYLVLLFCFTFMMCTDRSEEKRQPNIILFLVDDMGWQDTSVPFWHQETPFNEIYRTPNMERLANEGMKFTQAYATSVCSPTRISLMTGMNAARHRVTNWTLYADKIKPQEVNFDLLEFPMWNVNGLSPVTGDSLAVYASPLPQVLKDGGYRTIHVGKAHLGAIGTVGENPLNIGFDVNIAGHAAGAPASYLGTENFGNHEGSTSVWKVPGLEKYHGEDIFLSEAITREALMEIDSSVEADKPFFLYMSHYAVHSPIMGDPRFLEKYYDMGLDSVEAKYASLVEGMDKSLGDIMDKVKALDIEEETVIMFMSDNGGLSAVVRGGAKHTHNQPLSSGKGSMHEGGIREPMIVKYPGVTEANSMSDSKVIIEDFYTTIIEIAGLTADGVVQKVDGQSFMPILLGEELNSERSFIWHFPNEWGPSGPGIGAASTIRKGDYKLIYYHASEDFELFNIEEDIGEGRNLFEEEIELAQTLAKDLSQELRKMDAQLPIHKESGLKVKYPDEAF